MKSIHLVLFVALSLVCVTHAFAPVLSSLVRTYQTVVHGKSRSSSVSGLRCSGQDENKGQNPKIVKLGTTKTSWQGWGSTTVKREELKIAVDPANPDVGIKEALLKARESEAIAKYLGTSEAKMKAGITGDVEFVSYNNGQLVLRLAGNFWHNRQMVFDEVATFIKKATGVVNEVVIEDPKQLQGFAETSNAFKDQRQITVEELKAREAKGRDIYGNKLEGPAAEFKRKKLAATQKYQEEIQRRRQLENADAQTQLDVILNDTGAASIFQPGAAGDVKAPAGKDLRPEDILKAMLDS